MNERERLYGQAIIDFVNADTTDEAVFGFFDNVSRIFGFPTTFMKQAKKAFPSKANLSLSLGEPEKTFLELFVEEKNLRSSIKRTLDTTCYDLLDYDREKRKVTLQQYRKVEEKNGKQKKTDFSKPIVIRINDIGKRRIFKTDSKLYGRDFDVSQDLYKKINGSMQISGELADCQSKISKKDIDRLLKSKAYGIIDLHDRIKLTQDYYGEILEYLINGKKLSENINIEHSVRLYNLWKFKMTELSIKNDLPIETPKFNEAAYIVKPGKDLGRWWLVHHHEGDLPYLALEFLKGVNNRKYIRRCPECQKYHIAKRLNRKKYCGKRCRLAWHNQKRIKSGEHAAYKRKRRREGARASYYG